MIDVSHLSKSYGLFAGGRDSRGEGPIKAVDDLSFHVKKGEIVGFLGPNGAGKSTTLRILAGFLGASSGKVSIAGFDLDEEPMKARESLGYMPELSPLYPEMRASEYLAFRAELKQIPRKKRGEAVERALAEARIDDVAEVMIGHLSKGYRQRVGLADALLGSPPLLILDEPTAGLDPNQIREVRALIRRLGEEHTVLLSTHILSEVEATCTRALVIARGRLVAEGTIEEIRALRRASAVRIALRGGAAKAAAIAGAIGGVAKVSVESGAKGGAESTEGEGRLVVRVDKERELGAVTEAVVSALVSKGFGVREVVPEGASLEQVFSQLTEGERGESARGEGARGERGAARPTREEAPE